MKAKILIAAAWMGFLALPAFGQAPGGAAADETGLSDPLGELLTEEELAQFLKEARIRRLAMEREHVIKELDEGFLFDPAKVKTAVKNIRANPRNTWADNADRISKAFALVEGRFARACALSEKRDFANAAAALKPLISERDTSYLAAAKRFRYAEALAAAGRDEDAVEAFTDLVKVMPDRFSFSSLALLRAAEVYEKMHRRMYAMTLYKLWVDSFGLLDPKMAETLGKRVDRIAADYKDPLGTLSKKMGQVEQRLVKVDSGRQTQKTEKEIIAMLDDLIATAEEQSSGGGQGKGKGKGQKKGGKKGGGKGKGAGEGQGKGKGPPSGIGQPSSPAMVSRLVGGATLRPHGLSQERPADGDDDWGKLPPYERQKLLEGFKESMPERYRDLMRDYYRRCARDR